MLQSISKDKLDIIILCVFIIVVMIAIIISKINSGKIQKEIADKYNGFVDTKMKKYDSVGLVRHFTKNDEVNTNMRKIFDAAKNPWGITPAIMRAMRFTGLVIGIILAVFAFFLFPNTPYPFLGLMIGAICWFYPMYYYKSIAKEREEEWDKIYEFIWLIKHTTMIYDVKKSCMEIRNYIGTHSQYKEIIRGFHDFYNNWNPDEISEYILRFYNFPIPKELCNILVNMEKSGQAIEDNLDNLYVYAVNKQNAKVQKALSKVITTATLYSLPFLLASLIIALMVPMVFEFMKLM